MQSRLNLSQYHGAYITFHPRTGMIDERRSCVSNIRPEGMDFQRVTDKMLYLLTEMKSKKLSGVNLKDDYDKNILLS
jgi:ethanolamine ammonia-lyase small subunit